MRAPITPDSTLQRLTDALPQVLADKESHLAVEELRNLADRTTRSPRELTDLALVTAKRIVEQQAKPPRPDQLLALTRDPTLRLVTDETHLLDVVTEALALVQKALSGPNGMATLLWNRDSAKNNTKWWPVWEDDFSDLVMGMLKVYLEQRRIILNREVQVDRPGLPGAGRTDIHIQAATDPADPAPVTVVIECKGCWNEKLPSALDKQLVELYLRTPRTAGILLIGYFDASIWDQGKRPGRAHTSHDLGSLRREYEEPAQLHEANVRAVVVDCRPPSMQSAS